MTHEDQLSPFRVPDTVPLPATRRLQVLLRGPVQLCMWLTFGVVGVWLSGRAPGGGPVRGLVRAPEAEIRAARDGRLVTLEVVEGASVSAGAVIGRLDSSAHEVALALARGELALCAAELEAAGAELRLAALERATLLDERRVELSLAESRATLDLATDVVRRSDLCTRLGNEARQHRLALADCERQLASSRLVLARLQQQETRAAQLARTGADRLAPALDLALDRAAMEAEVAGRSAERSAIAEALQQTEAALQLATANEGARWSPSAHDAELERALLEAGDAAARSRIRALERSLATAEESLARLTEELHSYTLIAPISGRVVAVLAVEGTALVAGEPAVLVRAEAAVDAVVYLDERRAAAPPTEVLLARAQDPSRTARARVLRLMPGVEELPLPLRRVPTLPEYGRAAIVELPAELNLRPGERLRASVGNHSEETP